MFFEIASAFPTLNSILNAFGATRLRYQSLGLKQPKISVLIPARNEAHQIETLLQSLSLSQYPHYEIRVLDDHSTDGTGTRVREFSRNHPNLELFCHDGEALPSGWLGKNWACAQLARHSTGELLVFLDADVEIEDQALAALAETWRHQKSEHPLLLTCYPQQKTGSHLEKAIVPFVMEYPLTGLLPIPLANRTRIPSLTAANGQCITLSREDYFRLGGHEAVRDQIMEDMALAKYVKIRGGYVTTLLSDGLLKVRMYQEDDALREGFTKNLYLLMGHGSRATFFLLFGTLTILFFAPLVVSPVSLVPLFLQGVWILINARIFRQSALERLMFFHWGAFETLRLALRSYSAFKKKEVVWKGRRVLQESPPAESPHDEPDAPQTRS